MMGEQRVGFVLGDHTFLDPIENAPFSRLRAPKRQILGAPPPTYLDGIALQATPASPAAKALFTGQFCGHGEPTMTIFDIVIDGAETLEVGAIADPDDPAGKRNLPVLVARKPGSQWRILFRREWEEAQATLEGVEVAPLSPAELASVGSYGNGRAAIGFEYPADATSRDVVSWVAIDVLFDGNSDPGCVVNAELA
jgi:hypothetical protein